jgi:hypothetical protein
MIDTSGEATHYLGFCRYAPTSQDRCPVQQGLHVCAAAARPMTADELREAQDN